jgi:16S rRNA G527 N7-methylase RsmG
MHCLGWSGQAGETLVSRHAYETGHNNTYVVDEVAETTKRQDEKVNLAYQRAFSRLIICVEIVADFLVHHFELPRRVATSGFLS